MDWLRETQWFWWVGAALVLGLVEVASLDLVFAMLALAAVAAGLVAALGASFTVQALTFVAVAALLLAVLRPLALRKLKPPEAGERTNAAALSGRTAIVLQEVTDRSGLVKLSGEEWTARTDPGTQFAPQETVQVVRIEGATAIVAPVPAPEPGPPETDPPKTAPPESDLTDADPPAADPPETDPPVTGRPDN